MKRSEVLEKESTFVQPGNFLTCTICEAVMTAIDQSIVDPTNEQVAYWLIWLDWLIWTTHLLLEASKANDQQTGGTFSHIFCVSLKHYLTVWCLSASVFNFNFNWKVTNIFQAVADYLGQVKFWIILTLDILTDYLGQVGSRIILTLLVLHQTAVYVKWMYNDSKYRN